MSKRFNPPPNWPQPPLNWNPGPGWQPDPAWGPPPQGWQLWVDDHAPSAPSAPSARAAEELPPQRIFISYRRSDCQAQANGLHDGLHHRLPSAKVFMDVDAIPPGVDFEEHIRKEIEVCDLVLVMIGDNWMDPRPETGTRRIEEPEDFVRLEIESAFASPRCTVIPVLVEGATMPRGEDLPESIRRLARLNAIELSDHRWTSDLARLSEHIEGMRQQAVQHATRQAPAPSGGFVGDASHQATHQPEGPVNASVPSSPTWTPPPPPNVTANRSVSTGWLLALVAFFTCGLAVFAPAAWAVSRRRGDDAFRKRAYLIASVLTVVAIAAIAFFAAAPEDSEGNTTGPLSSAGAVLLLISLAGSTAFAIYVAVTDRSRAGTGSA